ncbi:MULTISPECIES: entericidin A/B family lipoprotein [unclassified Guyparkeria]|nr:MULTISPECIES: entericidin A/B family lipoprotein [unclassified Guyparkeria]
MIHRLITATLLAGLLAVTAGCNTMEGLGEDLQSLGGSVEGAASKNKNGE